MESRGRNLKRNKGRGGEESGYKKEREYREEEGRDCLCMCMCVCARGKDSDSMIKKIEGKEKQLSEQSIGNIR